MLNPATFARDIYTHTGGWIPMNPITARVALGDFGQLSEGRLRILGSLADRGLQSHIVTATDLLLDRDRWRLEKGVQQSFCQTEFIHEADDTQEYLTRQVLEFIESSAFFFSVEEPSCDLIVNWAEFSDDVIVSLTQAASQFREVYVVTSVVRSDRWSYAVAAKAGAQLETTTSLDEQDPMTLSSDRSCRVIRKSDLAEFAWGRDEPAWFFRGKKLTLAQDKRDALLRRLIGDTADASPQILSDWLRSDPLGLLRAGELSIANCLDYFSWTDISLDDLVMQGTA